MRRILALTLGLTLAGTAAADDLALSATEVHERVTSGEEDILFIDVRDPAEIHFVGFTDVVDANIPFKRIDLTGWNERKGVFAMPMNRDFAEEVAAALETRGMDRSDTVVTMCRSGSTRGKPSAEYLLEQGFESVHYVRHGFQGDRMEEGQLAGRRLKNGWQNSGLPWSGSLNREKMAGPAE